MMGHKGFSIVFISLTVIYMYVPMVPAGCHCTLGRKNIYNILLYTNEGRVWVNFVHSDLQTIQLVCEVTLEKRHYCLPGKSHTPSENFLRLQA